MTNIDAGYQQFTYDAPKICKGIESRRYTGFSDLRPGEYTVFHNWKNTWYGSLIREDALVFYWDGGIWYWRRVNSPPEVLICEKVGQAVNYEGHIFWAFIDERKLLDKQWYTHVYVRNQTTGEVLTLKNYLSPAGYEGVINKADVALEFTSGYGLPSDWGKQYYEEVYTHYVPCHGGDEIMCAEDYRNAKFNWHDNYPHYNVYNQHKEWSFGRLEQWKETK